MMCTTKNAKIMCVNGKEVNEHDGE
jgi:hypothetical protein